MTKFYLVYPCLSLREITMLGEKIILMVKTSSCNKIYFLKNNLIETSNNEHSKNTPALNLFLPFFLNLKTTLETWHLHLINFYCTLVWYTCINVKVLTLTKKNHVYKYSFRENWKRKILLGRHLDIWGVG